jgi:Zn-dependent protease
MGELILPQKIAAAILPILFAITVHEVAHGWMAKQLGDPTAQRLGRLTLNPIKHIDPLGTVLIPSLAFLLGGVIFGWAKPVPITWENLRHPKRDMAIVAAAGPAANLLMAFLWALVAKIGATLPISLQWVAAPLLYMGQIGIYVNVVLMILNLLSLPPLDGGRVVVGLLPGPLAWQLSRVELYGFFIVVALFATGLLATVVFPPVQFLVGVVIKTVGLH